MQTPSEWGCLAAHSGLRQDREPRNLQDRRRRQELDQGFAGDDSIGVVDMCSDPGDPSKLYAVLYHPASGSGDSAIEATSDIVKSIDGGSTWTALASSGLPEKARGRSASRSLPEPVDADCTRSWSRGFTARMTGRDLAAVHEGPSRNWQRILQSCLRRYAESRCALRLPDFDVSFQRRGQDFRSLCRSPQRRRLPCGLDRPPRSRAHDFRC